MQSNPNGEWCKVSYRFEGMAVRLEEELFEIKMHCSNVIYKKLNILNV